MPMRTTKGATVATHVGDAELVEAVRGGERERFGELVLRYQGLAFTVVLKIVKDRRTAEELLQESFLKAFRRLETLKQPQHFKPWLVQIATNEALKYLRKRRPECMSVERSGALFADERRELDMRGVEETAEMYFRLDRIGRALDELPPTYRTPIVLRYYAKLAYKDIATQMGLSLSATKFRLHYGIRLLKALVMKHP